MSDPHTPSPADDDDLRALIEALDALNDQGDPLPDEDDDAPAPDDDDAEPLPRADLDFLKPARPRSEAPPDPEPVAEVEPEPLAEVEPEPVTDDEPEIVAEDDPEPVTDDEPDPVAEVEPEPEPEPPIYRYRVAVPIKPEHQTLLNLARQSVHLEVAPAGIFTLHAPFLCADPAALHKTLETWAAEHLPLTLQLERVDATIIGAQRYVAALRLEPAEALEHAQASLVEALAPHHTPPTEDMPPLNDEGEPLPFAARLPISDDTPARAFPALIRDLQTRFMPASWTITRVELLRADLDDPRWEVDTHFEGSA